MLRESNVGKEFLPGKVIAQSWTQGHLNTQTKSRGEAGHFESLFHDARNGISAVVAPIQYSKDILKSFGAEEADLFFKASIGALRKPENVDPILDLLNTQRRSNAHQLPKGLQETADLLIKGRDGALNEKGSALSDQELDTLHDNLTAILAGLSNQPVELHYLGRATRGADGKFHIVEQPVERSTQIKIEVSLAPADAPTTIIPKTPESPPPRSP